MDEDVKRIVYVQTTGTEQPERSATVFFLAASGAAMDIEVAIFFTQLGPTLLQRGVPETLRVRKGGVTLGHFMEQARDVGVKFYVCQPSLDLTELKIADLIEGVELIGGAAFNNMALEADQVICF
jgi:predicted peroxiredoxin